MASATRGALVAANLENRHPVSTENRDDAGTGQLLVDLELVTFDQKLVQAAATLGVPCHHPKP